MALIGQPDMERLRLDNPIEVPRVLSILTWSRWTAEVKGLDAFPREDWPDNVPLLYYSYHIMVGLGTLFIAIMATAAFLLWRGRLAHHATDALGADARDSLPVHREQHGLEHRRAGAPALARLRAHAHRGGLEPQRLERQRALRAPGLHGHVRAPRPGSISSSSRTRSSTGRAPKGPNGRRRDGDLLVRRDRGDARGLRRARRLRPRGRSGAPRGGPGRATTAPPSSKAIGPFWDGNEVWLLAAGGVLVFAFPRLYAASFSGFFLPLTIVLWLLDGARHRPRVPQPPGGRLGLAALLGRGLRHLERAPGRLPRGGARQRGPRRAALPRGHVLRAALHRPRHRGRDRHRGLVHAARGPLRARGPFHARRPLAGPEDDRLASRALAGLRPPRPRWPRPCSASWSAPRRGACSPRSAGSSAPTPPAIVLTLLAVAGLLGAWRYSGRGAPESHDLRAFFSSCLFLAGLLGVTAFGLYPFVLPSNGEPVPRPHGHECLRSRLGPHDGTLLVVAGHGPRHGLHCVRLSPLPRAHRGRSGKLASIQPHHVSPGARWALATSGLTSTPYPGLSWMVR